MRRPNARILIPAVLFLLSAPAIASNDDNACLNYAKSIQNVALDKAYQRLNDYSNGGYNSAYVANARISPQPAATASRPDDSFVKMRFPDGVILGIPYEGAKALKTHGPFKDEDDCLRTVLPVMISEGIAFKAADINEEEKSFPKAIDFAQVALRYKSELNNLKGAFQNQNLTVQQTLVAYQNLVLKIRANVSPRLTDFLLGMYQTYSSYSTSEDWYKRDEVTDASHLLILQLLACGRQTTKENPCYSKHTEATLKNLDRITKEVVTPTTFAPLNARIVDLNRKVAELAEQVKFISPEFVNLAQQFQNNPDDQSPSDDTISSAAVGFGGSGGGGSGSGSGAFGEAGGGSGGGSGATIYSVGGRIELCSRDSCVDANYLFDNYYWAPFQQGYLVIEKGTLQNSYFTMRLLARVVKDQECFDPNLKGKDLAKVGGYSLLWSPAILAVATAETVVDGVQSALNRKFDFPYTWTKSTYRMARASADAVFDEVLARQSENVGTIRKVNYLLQRMVSTLIEQNSEPIVASDDYAKLTCTSPVQVSKNIRDGFGSKNDPSSR